MCCAYYRQQFWRDPFISDLNPSTTDGSGESTWTNWWSYMQARKLLTITTLWAATTRHHHTENLSGEFGKYLSTLIHRGERAGSNKALTTACKRHSQQKELTSAYEFFMSSKEDHCTALPNIEHVQCKSQLKATTLFFYAKWDQLKKTMIIWCDFSSSPKRW